MFCVVTLSRVYKANLVALAPPLAVSLAHMLAVTIVVMLEVTLALALTLFVIANNTIITTS